MKPDLLISLRAAIVTMLGCAVIYPAIILAIGTALVPGRAQGSLIYQPNGENGEIRGSRLIAQEFTRPEYLWPRPSAAGYDAARASGSNLAPSNPALRERALATALGLAASTEGRRPIPAELVAASGSGLDPHITLAGALYQAPRIAQERRITVERVEEVLRAEASLTTPWTPSLVNVLETNLALDRELGPVRRAASSPDMRPDSQAGERR